MKTATELNGRGGASTKAAAASGAHPRALLELRRLERVFADHEWSDRRVFVRARKRARARALEVLERNGSHDEEGQTAPLIVAAELFAAISSELTSASEDAVGLARQLRDIARLVQRLEDHAGVSRIALAREVLRAPELLTLAPTAAVEAQLAMLVAFAPLRSASLWTLDDVEQVTCLRHVGEGGPSRGAKELARKLLAGEIPQPGTRRLLFGLPVGRWRQPLAVLVGSAKPGMRDGCAFFLAESVAMLGAVLERDALLAGNAASGRALVGSSERKLTRLGFDLHDGPIQEVAILAEDLRLFQAQLEGLVGTSARRTIVRGRMEDLNAQLVSLEDQLRRLSREVHAPVLLNRPFSRSLRDVTQAFAARTNIEPQVELDGDMRLISVSQQIALLNVIHEALANVREHGHASEVEIAISVNVEGVEAQVSDNGRGFDLEPTLIRAARDGRLGLVAIHERVRLLGGQCRIDSQPGGPTVISVALERWEPLVQDAQPLRLPA